MDSTFDEEETERRKDEIVTERKNDHYTEVCDKYKEGVKFELNDKEWAKVKFDDLFVMKQEEAPESESEDTQNQEEKDAEPKEDTQEDADTQQDTEENTKE